MTITTEEFSARFHSLSGSTIGERRKNLFLLLNQIQNHEDINFSAIQPETPLEESFKVDALIRFRKIPDLIEVLKSENPVLIEKVLKVSSWFLEQALESTGVEEFVKNVFPQVSLNGKIKILNKLSMCLGNTEKTDVIFNAIREKYDLYLAWKLLPCCSKELIMECIKLSKMEFTPRQLKFIFKKHPELIESILETLTENEGKDMILCKYRDIFSDILQNNIALFLKLSKEYKPSFRLGRRATSRLVLENKQNVIRNAEQIYKLLHKKLITKRISRDFDEFYFHLLPKSLQRFKDDYNFYLELMPASVCRVNVLVETFRKKYGRELWDDSDCVTPGLLELMSVDEREAWMLTHPKPESLSEDVWVCLTKTEKSLPILKKRIAQISEVKERAQLVGCLVETCRINDDKAALIDVCKYFSIQHRHDDSSVLRCFLNTLKRCFCLDGLEDEHWKYIREIVQTFISKKVIPYYYHDWLIAYISYRLAKNLPIKEELRELSANICLRNIWNNTEIKPRYRKQLLLTCGEIISEKYKARDLENQSLQLLQAIKWWNRKHPKDQISLSANKTITDTLLEIVKEKDSSDSSYLVREVITYCIPTKTNKSEKMDILSLCFKRKNIYLEMNAMEYLIKYEPLFVLKFIDSMTNSILGMWYTLIKPCFWRFCRNYTHLEIPQKIVSICLNAVNHDEDESKKKNSINALSYLMQAREFIDFVAVYYPTDLIMDVNDEENQEKYKIQQAITASLKNVNPPSCVLESVLNFSKGDYLKFIQRSLHSVSHSVAEEKLSDFFESFMDRPVSVRKNAVYLTFKVLSRKEIEKMLVNFMQTEKNSSIRKFLFKGTFNYFAKNPSDLWWDFVKQNAKSIDVNDQEAFDVLLQVFKVPPAYLARYLVFTWEFLEALPNTDNKLDERKLKLLDDAVSSSVVPSLHKDFCLGIIQRYLFTTKELTDLQRIIYYFTCKFVVYSVSEPEQEERVKIVFEFLKGFIDRTWQQPGLKTSGRFLVFQFLRQFCSYFTEKKCLAKNVLVKFMELWNDFLKPYEAFEEYLYLQFTLIYVDFKKDSLTLARVGEKLAKLYDSLLNLYGNIVAGIFSESLNLYIIHFLAGEDNSVEENHLLLIESIISASSSSNGLVMAVSLLPLYVLVASNVKTAYNRIINILERNSDATVQLALSCYFTSLASQNCLVVPEKTSTKYGGRRMRFTFVEEYSSKYKK